MPPKRKAMAETSGNKSAPKTRNAKASKISTKSSAPKESAKSRGKIFKYCNANTLSKKPSYMNLQWPNFADFIEDKNQDIPKHGELVDEYCNRVSDLGIPVSEDGMKVCEKLDKECEKRDQEIREMCIYTDWNGWGISEVFCNLLKDFDRDLFKKTISPFTKWGYVEGFAVFLKTTDMMYFINNEDGPGNGEILDMLGIMILTTFDILSEHDLFKPDSEIKNIGIVCLLLLEFLRVEACDFDCGWGREVVRLCDNAGIDLTKMVRKQVSVSEKDIGEYRQAVKDNIRGWMTGEDETDQENNMYKKYNEMKNWTPKEDMAEERIEGFDRERMWYRWDWALEFKPFLKSHPGGNHYDLTKWSKKLRDSYTLGTKAFDKRIEDPSGMFHKDLW